MLPSTRLSSHPTPHSLSDLVTAGHTSRRYFSALAVDEALRQRQRHFNRGFASSNSCAGSTSVLWEERGEGALLQQAVRVVILAKGLDGPVVYALVVPRLGLVVLQGSDRRGEGGMQNGPAARAGGDAAGVATFPFLRSGRGSAASVCGSVSLMFAPRACRKEIQDQEQGSLRVLSEDSCMCA